MKRWTTILLFTSLIWSGMAKADFASGIKAYKKGDYGLAQAEFLAAAKSGDANSQYMLGRIYQSGLGLPANPDLALRWYRKAERNRSREARYALGMSYALGKLGLPKDTKEAARWFRLSADQGHYDAQFLLGVTLLDGDWGEVNIDEGVRLVRSAAINSHAEAQHVLAGLYATGKGVPLTAAHQRFGCENLRKMDTKKQLKKSPNLIKTALTSRNLWDDC